MSLNKCKKLTLVLLAVGLILGLTNFAQAQPKSGFAAKVGYFMPGDEDVEDIWGSGITFGADYLHLFSPYGIAFGAEYFSKEEEVILIVSEKATYTVTPITATFLYFFPGGEGFSAYIGGGIGYYPVTIEVELGILGIPLVAEDMEESGIGFHLQGGLNFGRNFFVEAKYSSAEIEFDAGDINAGGFTVLAGYRF
jgi:opacity protein-like surface antigen